ncbi:DUF58 domain-containing protein [Methylonatrum kenyense]|uniref:DUF58 domain-containing protein n=1 Tax=Methylonatrum kenyense TaxID=455253 RepID=UPI0020C0855C|nr:DUF58 domain-containing protein [Methylonatrum kenyense]MCK8515770.1 DUF58 domain-containing protein [Methylonatrum kenyense]
MPGLATAARGLADRWLDHRLGAPDRSMRLGYRRIFILPSPGGLLFVAMVAAIWLGAVNYMNNMAYLLAFLLTGLGTVAMIHAVRNLLGLELRVEQPEAVFAGESLYFPIELSCPAPRSRYGLICRLGRGETRAVDVPADGATRVSLPVAAERRGVLPMPMMRLHSEFPGGLFRAWSWPRFRCQGLVYPRPETGHVPPPSGGAGDGEGLNTSTGEEDFSGLRRYQAGDPLRQLAWRNWARGMELQTKQFGSDDQGEIWLDWQQLHGLDPEARLSRLCRWVLDLHQAAIPYGLRVPGSTLEPALGPAHRRACLEALARHPEAGAG